MKNKLTVLFDILIYAQNAVLGLMIVMIYDLTGFDAKFQDIITHRIMFAAAVIHLLASIFLCVFFFTNERTRFRIRIGKKLLIYDIAMSAAPYIYFLFCEIAYRFN